MPEKEPKRIRISPDSALATLLADAQATGESVLVDTGEVVYPVHVQGAEHFDILSRYDAATMRQALRASAGALTGVNIRELLTDVYEQRAQDTHGRPE